MLPVANSSEVFRRRNVSPVRPSKHSQRNIIKEKVNNLWSEGVKGVKE